MLKLVDPVPALPYQTASDVLTEFQQLQARLRPAESSRRWWWLAAASVAAIGIGAVVIMSQRPEPTLQAVELTRVTSDAGLTAYPALSRDGKLLAYASDRAGGIMNIWVQQVAGGEPIRVTDGPADDTEPSFSADGTMIAFRSERDGGGIYTVPALAVPFDALPIRDGDHAFRPTVNPSPTLWATSASSS